MMFLSPVLVYNNIALRLQLTSILCTLFYVIILSDTKNFKVFVNFKLPLKYGLHSGLWQPEIDSIWGPSLRKFITGFKNAH